jgi:hypothetical protein
MYYKGKNASKRAKHYWLDGNFGKPKMCEHCDKTEGLFEWCIKTGKDYSHNRDDYLRLCRSCHRKYDMTPEKREKAIINLKKWNPYYGTERKVGQEV